MFFGLVFEKVCVNGIWDMLIHNRMKSDATPMIVGSVQNGDNSNFSKNLPVHKSSKNFNSQSNFYKKPEASDSKSKFVGKLSI